MVAAAIHLCSHQRRGAADDKAIQPLLDLIVDYLPSPVDIPPMPGHVPGKEDEIVECHCNDKEPLAGLLFKLFSDSTRIRILYALSVSQMCVADLATLLQLSQPAVSHQLRVLRSGRLVIGRREGKMVFYSLADAHVRSILSQGLDHVLE